MWLPLKRVGFVSAGIKLLTDHLDPFKTCF